MVTELLLGNQAIKKNPSEEIAEKIGAYYAEMKAREEQHKLMREISEEHILNLTIEKELPVELETLEFRLLDGELTQEEFDREKAELREQAKILINDTYLFNEVLMKYKKRTTWHWKKEFDEELEDMGYLHVCKKIMKAQELRYDIAPYQNDSTEFLKVFSSTSESKEEKEKRKRQEAAERLHKKRELQKLDMDDMVSLFKKNQRELNRMKKVFTEDKEELLKVMNNETVTKVFLVEDQSIGLKIQEQTGDFNKEQIFTNTIDKRFFFYFRVLEDGTTECVDKISGEEFSFKDTYTHHTHTISRNGKHLIIDDFMLETYSPDEMDALSKSQKKKALENGYLVSLGVLEVSGSDFFKDCPVSSKEVDDLIEKNALHPSVRDQYRYMKSQDDMTIFFEMIESEKNAQRGSFFQQKKSWHTATVLRDKERVAWFTENQV